MTERKKILIVDDELGIRELLSEALQHRGYDTRTAVNGKDALEQADEFLPDLILLDLTMPVMDGWKALGHFRNQEKTKDIPVIMLTARSETEEVFKSEDRHAVDYFIKPINMEELLIFIKRYISLPR